MPVASVFGDRRAAGGPSGSSASRGVRTRAKRAAIPPRRHPPTAPTTAGDDGTEVAPADVLAAPADADADADADCADVWAPDVRVDGADVDADADADVGDALLAVGAAEVADSLLAGGEVTVCVTVETCETCAVVVAGT